MRSTINFRFKQQPEKWNDVAYKYDKYDKYVVRYDNK